MHEHDFDLIAAYSDGTASAEETAAASHAISQCTECADEHRAQVEVLDVLASAAQPSMTYLERSRLHHRLKAATSEPKPEIGWFTRYAPRVAAVAAGFAVVGLASVAMLGQIGGDESADLADTTIEASSADEATEEDIASDGDQLARTFQEESLSFDDSLGEVMGAEAAPAEPPSPTFADRFALDPIPLDEEALALLLESQIEDLVTFYQPPADADPLPCSDQLPDSADVVVSIVSVFEDEPASVFIYMDNGRTMAVALSVETCEVLSELTAES